MRVCKALGMLQRMQGTGIGIAASCPQLCMGCISQPAMPQGHPGIYPGKGAAQRPLSRELRPRESCAVQSSACSKSPLTLMNAASS